MYEELVKKPVCYTCDTIVDVWSNGCITNAWQKGNFNHYDFKCPICNTKETFKIELDNELAGSPPGSVFVQSFLTLVKG